MPATATGDTHRDHAPQPSVEEATTNDRRPVGMTVSLAHRDFGFVGLAFNIYACRSPCVKRIRFHTEQQQPAVQAQNARRR
jgi:hypothetical protein